MRDKAEVICYGLLKLRIADFLVSATSHRKSSGGTQSGDGYFQRRNSDCVRTRGSGSPRLLVHGSTADHTRWTSILPGLERRFTVLAMDRRGRGASGDAQKYSLEREYDDVAAVIRAAGREVDLFGHSFGALCAMEAALNVDNLRRIVLRTVISGWRNAALPAHSARSSARYPRSRRSRRIPSPIFQRGRWSTG